MKIECTFKPYPPEFQDGSYFIDGYGYVWQAVEVVGAYYLIRQGVGTPTCKGYNDHAISMTRIPEGESFTITI